ncbi:MAG: hypothetical protein HFI63_02330 [Lachnospiraceae bacterium]|nr:hypothetical protein [Lachnospiraceae bacterium]
MKKRCAWMLAAVLLAVLFVPKMAAVASEESGETRETEETETPDGTEAGSPEEAANPDGTTNPEAAVQPEEQREALKAALEKSSFEEDEVIADGVFIGATDVGGMSAEQALEAVLAYTDEIGKKTLTVTLEGADDLGPIQTTAAELGLHTDDISGLVMEALALGKGGNLIVRYKAEKDLQTSNQIYEFGMAIDENRVNQFITEQTAGLSVEPVNAEISKVSGGFSVSESKTGVKVDVPATVSAIVTAFKDWNREDLSMAAVAEVIQPERSTELLSQIQDPLGSFSASTSDRSRGKLQNLSRGVELTNGILIMPGESWSMHDALAPFSAGNGYTQQIAYQSGGYVQEYGGGICQLATTLYNTALRSEINISKRSNHSMVVYYTDFGLDATINDGGSKDLELTNDFDFPVYIEGYHNGSGEVTYTIWGKETRPANRTIRFYGKTLSKESVPEQIIEDPTQPVGYEHVEQASSYPAVTAEAYKEILIDGEVVDRIRLHTDKYIASPRKVIRGTALPIDPNTGLPIDPNAPATPETPAPETPAETPAPTPETPAPTPETPAPTPETPAPTPETPAPTPEAPAPTQEAPAA